MGCVAFRFRERNHCRTKRAKTMDYEKMTPIGLTLPWPPSVNHYWKRNRNGGVRVGVAGVRFRDEVMFAALQQLKPLRSLSGPVSVSIVACQPDRRRRDLDNLLKSTLDALTAAKIYGDDSQIHELDIRWGKRVDGGRLDVTVRELG